jgi:hypothetical protein
LFGVLVLYKLPAWQGFYIYEHEAIDWFISFGCDNDSGRSGDSVCGLALA